MNDVDRASELVAAARAGFEPTGVDRDRVRQRLGAAFAGAAGTTAVTAAAATGATAKGISALGGHTLLGLGKLLVGTVLVTVGTGTTIVVAARAVSSRPAAAPVAAPTPSVLAREALPAGTTDARVSQRPQGEEATADAARIDTRVEPTSETTTEPQRRVSPSHSSEPLHAAPTVSAPALPAPSLDAELSLLHEAKRALTSADYGAARAGLARLDREHPAGALLEEREALRAVLTCSTVAAERGLVAAAFRQRYPRSMYAPRVESACAPGATGDPSGANSVTDPALAGH